MVRLLTRHRAKRRSPAAVLSSAQGAMAPSTTDVSPRVSRLSVLERSCWDGNWELRPLTRCVSSRPSHVRPTPQQPKPPASPSGCPSNLPNEGAAYSLDSSSGDIDVALTAYQGNEIDVDTDNLSISPHSPLCVLQSGDLWYLLPSLHHGDPFMYVFRGNTISVIRIQVLPPYDAAPWGTITFMGLLLFALGIVGFGVSSYNSRKRPYESLRRADDAQREGSYDPKAAAESAFRAFGENQRW